MFAPVTIEETAVTFHNAQQSSQDTVFNTRDLHSRHGSALFITNDKDYNKPDKGQYIFSTMGIGLHAMFSNNMVVPIRTKSTLNGHHMYSKIIEHTNEVDNGIYIIDYFTIYNDGNCDIDAALTYYINSCNIEYDRNVVNDIVEQMTQRSVRQRSAELKVRLVTFVPAKFINEHMNVMVDKSDVLIIKGALSNNIVHPNSRLYKENDTKTIKAMNAIEIEIVDNNSSSPYFIRLGNNIERFIPTKDMNRPNGARMNVFKNGTCTLSKTCGLNDITSVFGMHLSKNDAESDGDVGKLLAMEKLTVENKKISLELTKIEHETIKLRDERDFYREKFRHEIAMQEQKFKLGQLDMSKKLQEADIMFHKAEIEILTTTHKYKMDTAHAAMKNRMDTTKLLFETGIKLTNVIKTFM